jgi:hypothetical protein
MAEVPELEFESGEIELRLQSSIDDKRYEPREHAVFYPALSVPLGAADEFVCPPSHRAAERPQNPAATRCKRILGKSYETAERLQSPCGRGDVLRGCHLRGWLHPARQIGRFSGLHQRYLVHLRRFSRSGRAASRTPRTLPNRTVHAPGKAYLLGREPIRRRQQKQPGRSGDPKAAARHRAPRIGRQPPTH